MTQQPIHNPPLANRPARRRLPWLGLPLVALAGLLGMLAMLSLLTNGMPNPSRMVTAGGTTQLERGAHITLYGSSSGAVDGEPRASDCRVEGPPGSVPVTSAFDEVHNRVRLGSFVAPADGSYTVSCPGYQYVDVNDDDTVSRVQRRHTIVFLTLAGLSLASLIGGIALLVGWRRR